LRLRASTKVRFVHLARLRVCGRQIRVGDPHPVLVALHRAFKHVANAQLLADLLGVDALALKGEGRVARNDEAVLDAREFGGEIFGDSVCEIILRRKPERGGPQRRMDLDGLGLVPAYCSITEALADAAREAA
jgi:hypothetical protein